MDKAILWPTAKGGQLPAADFLADIKMLSECSADRYRTARWLATDFENPVWSLQFDRAKGKCFEIDWRVRLGLGPTLLTDNRHRPLLTTLRTWLTFQTHTDATNYALRCLRTEYEIVIRATLWIDYLLIHAEQLQLPAHGLGAITHDQLIEAIYMVASNSRRSISVYQWPSRLTSYLREHTSSVNSDEARAMTREYPFLARDVPPSQECLTELSQEEIVLARCWLWREGYYVSLRNDPTSYQWSPFLRPLVEAIYMNTLRGYVAKPSAPELCLTPGHRAASREYPAVPIKHSGGRMNERVLRGYITSLRSLAHLHVMGQEVPFTALQSIDVKGTIQALDPPVGQRFRSVPASVVFKAVRHAIEYALEFGEDLVEAYLLLAESARSAGGSISVFCHNRSLKGYLSTRLRRLGVRAWTCEPSNAGVIGGPALSGHSGYYRLLRSKPGLWELLRVLYGAIEIVAGSTMARRSGELVDLVAGSCLNASEDQLLFRNRKSGVLGYRELEERPIPPIAVRLIKMLESLQNGLIRIGVLQSKTALFAPPTVCGNAPLCEIVSEAFDDSVDLFCDYFELPLNTKGERYYLRQHQFRRFFAMMFFWSNQFGGLDTLRWFLGHSDIAHIYHYITEVTPGTVLRGVAAEWALSAVKDHDNVAERLSDLIEERFHTRKFQILKDEELQEYIEELMLSGVVVIEPEFLDDSRSYRILIRIIPRSAQ